MTRSGNTAATRSGLPFAASAVLDGGFALYHRLLLARPRDPEVPAADVPALVLAPHPDDETLGCGALIARKAAAGAPVTVVFACDGRHSHRSGLVPPDALAALRRREALAACARLGVGAERVGFLDHEDGRLADAGGALARRIAGLAEACGARELFAPSAQDGHPDHRALSAAARAALAGLSRHPVLYEYPVWFWDARAWVEPGAPRWRQAAQLAVRPLAFLAGARPAVVAAGPFLDAKRRALAEHRSQVENLTGEPGWATLPSGFLRHLMAAEEIFFRIPGPSPGAPP
ncbi:PIG-L family deacetylase [Azospirillum sp. RWY-5-1]|uniref:PIG-L family deacetylase n=1 Tax=Azospirillum oleiclasticum TaxID=2735135 RepID=A0ABX2TLZ1_9PROT|nr:PIG-L family deacetylase [Azospirillum oleiclasticum]NYZ16248.1 PIG-L family deacetylase [Azospirillum oleiclasticum]NYZ23735.1 PIG-L family deacetylase [Azospirillum oleiclasticum]